MTDTHNIAPAAALGRSLIARFEEYEGHRSVVVRWRSAAPARAQVLFLPAFGDEMNQTRRMLKLVAEALAVLDIESRVFDLHGTGDSSADFSEATVERWMADCRTTAQRMQAEANAPLLLLGCRLGMALAVQLSHELAQSPVGLIGWAPLLQGRAQLSGMLRLQNMSRLQGGAGTGTAGAPDPRARWGRGEAAMVGGYPISPALAEQLEAFNGARAPRAAGASLFDLRLPAADGSVSPSEALRRLAAGWTEQGVQTSVHAVSGAAFWNVADFVDVPQLIDATVREVDRLVAGTA